MERLGGLNHYNNIAFILTVTFSLVQRASIWPMHPLSSILRTKMVHWPSAGPLHNGGMGELCNAGNPAQSTSEPT